MIILIHLFVEENKKGDKIPIWFYYYLIISILIFIVGIILIFENFIISLILVEIGAIGPLMAFFVISMLHDTYPEPTLPQQEDPQIEGPIYTIYYLKLKNKKKFRGFLDGNIAFAKDHKYKFGWYDARNPDNIEIILPKNKLIWRIQKGNILDATQNDEIIGKIKDLNLIRPPPYEYNIKLEKNEEKGYAMVSSENNLGKRNIGIIEGDLDRIDDAKFFTILYFHFQIGS